jgi:hypothetical protein
MLQVYEEQQKLQWIKGDKVGTVEEVLSQDHEWTKFKSGSRISTALINEFMLLVEGEPLELNQTMSTLGMQTVNQQQTVITKAEKSEEKVVDKANPIKLLFDKQKKTDDIQLNINFSINVPTTDIFNILSITFEETEVIEELTQFILKQIDNDLIKSRLDETVKELILTRYKS